MIQISVWSIEHWWKQMARNKS